MLTRGETILISVVALVMFGVCGWVWRQEISSGGTDFVAFYCGGKTVGTGTLYDNAAQFNCHQEVLQIGWMPNLLFVRPAWYAVALKPLASLPFFVAYWLWTILNAVALLWVLYVLGREDPSAFLLAGLFAPTYMSVFLGQDIALITAAITSFILASRRAKETLCGAVLSLCSIKFHLFAFFPVAVMRFRRWRLLLAAVVNVLVFYSLSGFVEGFSWPLRYVRVLRDPAPHPHPGVMPNLRTLLAAFGLDQTPLVLTLSVILAGAVIWSIFKTRNPDRASLTAILGGILIAPHIYLQDLLLLLPCYFLTKSDPGLRPSRILLTACLFPATPVLLTKGTPWSALVPGILLAAAVSSLYPTRPRIPPQDTQICSS